MDELSESLSDGELEHRLSGVSPGDLRGNAATSRPDFRPQKPLQKRGSRNRLHRSASYAILEGQQAKWLGKPVGD